jgi:hypothetical protein
LLGLSKSRWWWSEFLVEHTAKDRRWANNALSISLPLTDDLRFYNYDEIGIILPEVLILVAIEYLHAGSLASEHMSINS